MRRGMRSGRCNTRSVQLGAEAEEPHPHSLRATAATFNAYRGVPQAALQSMFGWADPTVPQKYIQLTGEKTAQALREAHSV